MKTILTIARADWGAALHATARRLAYVAAVLVVAAEITYRAGLASGRAVHWLSGLLGGLASGRIDRAQTARTVVAWAHGVIDPAPPAIAPPVVMACAPEPVAITAPPLNSLTVAQLRKMARARGLSTLARGGRRADLLAALTD